MACAAARRAAREALLVRTGMNAQEVWERVRFWTPITIAEALEWNWRYGQIRARDYNGRRYYYALAPKVDTGFRPSNGQRGGDLV